MKIPFKVGDLIQPIYLEMYSSRLAKESPLHINYRNKTFKILEIEEVLANFVKHKYYAFSAICLENKIIYGFVYPKNNIYRIIRKDINYKIKIK